MGAIASRQLSKNSKETTDAGLPKQVKAVALKSLKDNSKLEIQGTVKAANKVDLVAQIDAIVLEQTPLMFAKFQEMESVPLFIREQFEL